MKASVLRFTLDAMCHLRRVDAILAVIEKFQKVKFERESLFRKS